MPETSTFFSRKKSSRRSPVSSSPTAVTGITLAPRAAKLLAALAPPPGTICVSLCLRMRTGASRETRVMSPNWKASATKSPRTTTVLVEKRSTYSARATRSTDGAGASCFLERLVIYTSEAGSDGNIRERWGGFKSDHRGISICDRSKEVAIGPGAEAGMPVPLFSWIGGGDGEEGGLKPPLQERMARRRLGRRH